MFLCERPFKKWQDGTELSVEHWAPGEPNNHGTDGETESCVEQLGSADWNDVACRKARFFMCNYKGKDHRQDPLTSTPDAAEETTPEKVGPWKCSMVKLDGVERKECLRRSGGSRPRKSNSDRGGGSGGQSRRGGGGYGHGGHHSGGGMSSGGGGSTGVRYDGVGSTGVKYDSVGLEEWIFRGSERLGPLAVTNNNDNEALSIPPFMYGTHYSTPGYVLYYLVRQVSYL